MNENGHPETLVPSHPANLNAVRHGVYSSAGRALSPRAGEIADAIMASPRFSPMDELGAAEIARLTALIEAMDADIAAAGLTRRGDARTMVKLRLQASRRLQEWLDRYAMTPRGRAVRHQYVRCGLAAEQDVQLREPEAERVALVDERHANVVNQ